METKYFSALAILGVVTGRVLAVGGMREIHDVLDFLCPGIGPVGAVAVHKTVLAELYKQYPELESYLLLSPEPKDERLYDAWTAKAVEHEDLVDGFTLSQVEILAG